MAAAFLSIAACRARPPETRIVVVTATPAPIAVASAAVLPAEVPSVPAPTEQSAVFEVRIQPPTPTRVPAQIKILNIDTRVTESNSVWSRFAWRLTLKNFTDRRQVVDATIEFQDRDGFIVDTDRDYNLPLEPFEERTFTGDSLIKAEVRESVDRVGAKIRSR